MSKKKSIITKLIFILLLFFIIIGFYIYKIIWTSYPSIKKSVFIYVYPKMNIAQLTDTLYEKKVISEKLAFKILAKEMKIISLKPGKYRITNKMNLPAIIRIFKYGKDENVTINIHPQIYYLEDFIQTIDNKLMINHQDIRNALHQYPYIKDEDWMNYLFIKSYSVNWAIPAQNLLDSIKNYYNKIWNTDRKKLLHRTGLSQKEAMILASIVQNESHIYSEQKKIAGVYINRLKKQMPLQADPTLKFANHKMNAQRVYHTDKNTPSPYNTYIYKGLPPSTIGSVSLNALDAVLHFEEHRYLYFCAKPELNGYSNYSETFQQHLTNAQQYQKQLNRLNIK